MLPDTLTICGVTFNKSSEDNQTGATYLPAACGWNNRTSFNVRNVSKPNQPFVRFLISYREPARDAEGAVAASSVVANTTITIPKGHVFLTPNGGVFDPVVKAVASMALFYTADLEATPEEHEVSTFGDLVFQGHL